MKAISLWQPWASAIALGSKRIETRSWETSHRGFLAIHASKRCIQEEMIEVGASWSWCGALRRKMGEARDLAETLPFGAVVAVCELVDCRPTANFMLGEIRNRRHPFFTFGGDLDQTYSWTEEMMGNFELGRFGWVLAHIRPLKQPLPWKGAQGFFTVPDELILPRLQEMEG